MFDLQVKTFLRMLVYGSGWILYPALVPDSSSLQTQTIGMVKVRVPKFLAPCVGYPDSVPGSQVQLLSRPRPLRAFRVSEPADEMSVCLLLCPINKQMKKRKEKKIPASSYCMKELLLIKILTHLEDSVRLTFTK